MQITVEKIAIIVDGTVIGDGNALIDGPAKIEEATEGSISFIAHDKYIPFIASSSASVYLVSKDFNYQEFPKKTFIRVEDVYTAISQLLAEYENLAKKTAGIARTAIIHTSAQIGKEVFIGEYVVLEEGVIIGDFTHIMANCVIGASANVGSNVKLYAGAMIYHGCLIGNNCIIHSNSVIGSDGFGFARQEDGSFKKIPQVGNVVLEDNVEIGSGTTIDRATMGSTLIKKGAKLDNLIQIGHNVEIGENTVIAAQVGIAGSTKIGANCMIGGQAGIAGHLNIADGTLIQGKSGMSKSVKKKGTKWYGYPAIEYSNYLRSFAIFKNLEKLVERVKKLEEKHRNFGQ